MGIKMDPESISKKSVIFCMSVLAVTKNHVATTSKITLALRQHSASDHEISDFYLAIACPYIDIHLMSSIQCSYYSV